MPSQHLWVTAAPVGGEDAASESSAQRDQQLQDLLAQAQKDGMTSEAAGEAGKSAADLISAFQHQGMTYEQAFEEFKNYVNEVTRLDAREQVGAVQVQAFPVLLDAASAHEIKLVFSMIMMWQEMEKKYGELLKYLEGEAKGAALSDVYKKFITKMIPGYNVADKTAALKAISGKMPVWLTIYQVANQKKELIGTMMSSWGQQPRPMRLTNDIRKNMTKLLEDGKKALLEETAVGGKIEGAQSLVQQVSAAYLDKVIEILQKQVREQRHYPKVGEDFPTGKLYEPKQLEALGSPPAAPQASIRSQAEVATLEAPTEVAPEVSEDLSTVVTMMDGAIQALLDLTDEIQVDSEASLKSVQEATDSYVQTFQGGAAA